MTAPFLSDFDDRRRQVRHYLAVVLAAEKAAALGSGKRSHERRLLTLRAGTFLLLYNLIEATTRGAVEAIHDSITSANVPFGSLTVELRREVIKGFKVAADPDVHHTIPDIAAGFVGIAFEKDVEFAGNVDARLIRKLGASYGFSCDTAKEQTWGGVDLLTIKERRNALAHGDQTFEEVGRDYPSRELVALSRRATCFMKDILENVAAYLEAGCYLEGLAKWDAT